MEDHIVRRSPRRQRTTANVAPRYDPVMGAPQWRPVQGGSRAQEDACG